jgi:hypothetical protein
LRLVCSGINSSIIELFSIEYLIPVLHFLTLDVGGTLRKGTGALVNIIGKIATGV